MARCTPWLYIYGWLNGGSFLSMDGRTSLLNSPAIVEALAYMTEVYDIMGGAAEVYRFQSMLQGGDLDPFLNGKVAMKIDGDWFLSHIARNRRDPRFAVTLAPAPEGKERCGWLGGWSYVIPRGAKHPDASWELIRYLVSKRAAAIWHRAMRQTSRSSGQIYIPGYHARRDINEWNLETFLYSEPDVEEKFKDAVRVMADSIETAKYRPVSPAGQLLWSEHVRAMEGGIFKRYDPTDIRRNAQIALDIGNGIVQAELDRINKTERGPPLPWWLFFVAYGWLLVFGFGIAHWLSNRKMAAHGYFRTEFRAGYLFALPWFIGLVIFGGSPLVFSLIISLCSYDVLSPPAFVGLGNYLEQVGLTEPAWLQNQIWSKPALILMGLWGAGGAMIIWLAGLKGIPRHLYEAAEIDGAGRVQRFRSVTLPMLAPYILLNLIMGLIGTFQIFTQAYVMTQGGPLDSTLFYAYALSINAFRYLKMGYASAMAWVLFAIVLVLTIAQLRLSKIWVHYEVEK